MVCDGEHGVVQPRVSRANTSTTPSTTGFLLPFAGNPNAAVTTAMYAPLAVQEVVLAGSLILRGFRTANTPTRDGRTS